MRLLGLLILLLVVLFVFVPLCAQASDPQGAADHPDDFGLLQKPRSGWSVDDFRMESVPEFRGRLRSYSLFSEGVDCYKIRTYRVEQDEPDSDSTHMAGSSTCQPVSGYTVKSLTPTGSGQPKP